MQVSSGTESVTFPPSNATPNSPPTTPGTSSPNQAIRAAGRGFHNNKYAALFGADLSPPEHLEPVAGHQFSYARRPRTAESSSDESNSDVGSEDSADEESEDEGSIMEIEIPLYPEVSARPIIRKRKSTVIICAVEDSEVDFTIEEISEDDIGYDDDLEVLLPFQYEDAPSEIDLKENVAYISDSSSEDEPDDVASDADSESSDSDDNDDLVEDMSNLQCEARKELLEKEKQFEEAQRQKYLRKKKRWSKGGNHKRNLAQSIGSDSDNEDITPLNDIEMVGSSARRLRRRTEGPEMRPRKSLLFEDPPKEIEELKYLEANGEVLESDDELMLPTWMYPATVIAVESDDDEDEDEDEVEDDGEEQEEEL